jgi:putative IMPACT (imprinted ancient) family translation regulator
MHARTHAHSRDSSDAITKAFNIKYCKILHKVIQEVKKQHYNIERIVLLDFIHRLVSQKTNKIEELKI